MAILIVDPEEARQVRAQLVTNGGTCDERPTEMWEGVEVVPPVANTEHFRIAAKLNAAFMSVIDWDAGDQAVPGGNVSDRDEGWQHNYRNPDVLVVLAGGVAVDRGSYWRGGPDLVVEIISPGEDPTAKLDFYAKVKTREVLIVDRDPWVLELYQLRNGRLECVGRSDLVNPADLASGVLPLTFRLRPASTRPVIEVTHTTTGQTWTA
jgi:Uma2 family endonuclease